MTTPTPLTQDELKALVGQAALRYVVPGDIVGVGTGSTVNKFIDAMATIKDQVRGAVSSSVASTERLRAIGIPVSLFTGIFALARTVGWIAQLNEMLADPEYKIGRPRQLFTGSPRRDV